MKPFYRALLFSLTFLLIFSSCETDFSSGLVEENDPRGAIIGSKHLITLDDKDAVADYMDEFNPAVRFLFPPNNGIEMYRINYETIDAWGNMTNASGLLAVPINKSLTYPIASYQHGTIVKKTDAPSMDGGEKVIGVGLAADGYVVVLPDYLGLGESPGLHPYVHAETEASAGLDMLRASKTFCEQIGIQLNEQLFLFGYSQGGHAVVALHREIQLNRADEFTVTACAAMSGPYDVSGVQAEVIIQNLPYPTPYYLPYIMMAYSEAYGVLKFNQVIKEPYASTLPPLFNGYIGSSEIDDVMPDTPNLIIRAELLEAFKTDQNHWFRNVLKDNDVHDWAPTAPVKLMYCEADEQVSYLNSLVAFQKFNENGALDLELININKDFGHGDCAIPCFQAAKSWFDDLKD